MRRATAQKQMLGGTRYLTGMAAARKPKSTSYSLVVRQFLKRIYRLKNADKRSGKMLYKGKVPGNGGKVLIQATDQAQLGNDVRLMVIAAKEYTEYLYWNWAGRAGSYPLTEPFVTIGPQSWLMTGGYDQSHMEIHNSTAKDIKVSVFLAMLAAEPTRKPGAKRGSKRKG